MQNPKRLAEKIICGNLNEAPVKAGLDSKVRPLLSQVSKQLNTIAGLLSQEATQATSAEDRGNASQAYGKIMTVLKQVNLLRA